MVYTIAVEHFVQVGVLINRGATHADASIGQVRRVLHCQMCEEWALHPDTRSPLGKAITKIKLDLYMSGLKAMGRKRHFIKYFLKRENFLSSKIIMKKWAIPQETQGPCLVNFPMSFM